MRQSALFTCMALLFSFSARAEVVLAPSINSPLTASGQINVAFLYTVTATGDGPIVFSAAGLPEGLALSVDAISGAPTEFGEFQVTLTATNLVGADSEVVVLTILPLPVSGGSLSDADRDGDGFSDELEIALNSSPTRQSSVPFENLIPMLPEDIVIKKIQIKLNFARPRKDQLSFDCTLRVGDNTQANGKSFVADVAGIVVPVALDLRGRAQEQGLLNFSVNLPRTGATGVPRFGKVKLRIMNRELAGRLLDEGITNTTTGTVLLSTVVIFDGRIYRAKPQANVTNKAGKTGQVQTGR